MRRRLSDKRAKRRGRLKSFEIGAGVIGLGLMGTSIVACLLAAGHRVVVVTRNSVNHKGARRHVMGLLRQMKRESVLTLDPLRLGKQLSITSDFAALRDCGVVIESIVEDIGAKKDVLRRIEAVVSPDTLIGSNTSGIPITMLQERAAHPERILGLHWAEPAHITRFMEVIAGDRTDTVSMERALTLARAWGKDPTCVRRDIRGFIANRLMYAMLREAFYLVEHGYATPEDVDRSAQNDMGWWLTFAGPFRFMDLTGIPAYAAVMHDLLPAMCNGGSVPALMRRVVASGAKGVSNAKGFYRYTPAEARRWEKDFLAFTYDVRRLASKYSLNSQTYSTSGDATIRRAPRRHSAVRDASQSTASLKD